MGQVLTLGAESVDQLLFGNKGHILNNYLSQQLERIQPTFNEFSSRVYNALQSSYNFINDKMVQYGILNQLSQQGVHVADDYYRELLSFQELQTANLTMQRWVMSHPQIREYYLQQNIDGYSETYNNVFGKGVGEADYNYRRVMDGALVDNDDDTFTIKYYVEDLLEGDVPLDHYQKTRIRNTYEAIDHVLKTCKFDFTNVSEEPSKINLE